MNCITKQQKSSKGVEFGDQQNEIDRAISTLVIHELTENPVTGDTSEVVQLDARLDSNEDAEDSITIQDTSQDA